MKDRWMAIDLKTRFYYVEGKGFCTREVKLASSLTPEQMIGVKHNFPHCLLVRDNRHGVCTYFMEWMERGDMFRDCKKGHMKDHNGKCPDDCPHRKEKVAHENL